MDRPLLCAIVACGLTATASTADITLLGSFDPPGGQLNAIGYADGLIYAHFSGSGQTITYTPDGTQAGTLPFAPGAGNDSDIDFALSPLDVGGTIVPVGTMLVTQGEPSTQTLYAMDPGDGTILASQALAEPIGQLTGGSHDPFEGDLVAIDWSNDVIRRFNTDDGSAGDSFGFGSGFDAFFSDVEVSAVTGNMYLVSSSQNFIRVLGPTGSLIEDLDVDSLGVSGMSGIALDHIAAEAWISSTNGTIYRLGGFPKVPAPGTLSLAALGLLTTRRRR